jgi:tRNA uridine 5-carboxymethylaminomethyl modification enzyme
VTTGTFLRGLMHIGQNKNEGGRLGDFSSKTLSASLMEIGMELRRLKTGTPPRIFGSSIDFGKMQEQKGDANPTLFAFHDTRDPEDLFHVEHSGENRLGWTPGSDQVSCWMTHTTESTAQIVRANLHKSAMYSGEIEGVGPQVLPEHRGQVCAVRGQAPSSSFPRARRPERRTSITSTAFRRRCLSMSSSTWSTAFPGLEHAVLLRPAYAVEYDFAPPTQLYPSLESKRVENLFLGRADQRHLRLRGGRRPGSGRRRQCRQQG